MKHRFANGWTVEVSQLQEDLAGVMAYPTCQRHRPFEERVSYFEPLEKAKVVVATSFTEVARLVMRVGRTRLDPGLWGGAAYSEAPIMHSELCRRGEDARRQVQAVRPNAVCRDTPVCGPLVFDGDECLDTGGLDPQPWWGEQHAWKLALRHIIMDRRIADGRSLKDGTW